MAIAAASAVVATQGQTFEVASVKRNTSGDVRSSIGGRPGGITVTNNTLRNIILNVYGLQSFQIVGGPEWLDRDRFDILANAEGTPAQEQLMVMARALLAERFNLKVHAETRQLPIYALVLARSDRKLGAQLRQSGVDCGAIARTAARGTPPPPTPPGERPSCGLRTVPGRFTGGGVTMPQLSRNLSNFVERIVLDRTELAGGFDLDLAWTPDRLPPRAPGTPEDQPLRINGIEIDPNGPSIFTAVQEQLGLKLESTRGPVEVLVIDHAEQPGPD